MHVDSYPFLSHFLSCISFVHSPTIIFLLFTDLFLSLSLSVFSLSVSLSFSLSSSFSTFPLALPLYTPSPFPFLFSISLPSLLFFLSHHVNPWLREITYHIACTITHWINRHSWWIKCGLRRFVTNPKESIRQKSPQVKNPNKVISHEGPSLLDIGKLYMYYILGVESGHYVMPTSWSMQRRYLLGKSKTRNRVT